MLRFFADLLRAELDTAGGRLNQFWVKVSVFGALVVLLGSSLRFRIGDGAMVSWGYPWYIAVIVLLIIALQPPASAFLLYVARREGIDVG